VEDGGNDEDEASSARAAASAASLETSTQSRRRPARSIESAIRAAAQLGQLPSWDQSCGVDDDFLSKRPRPKTRNQPTPLVDAVSPLSPCIHHGSGALIRTMSVRGGIASGLLVLSNCASKAPKPGKSAGTSVLTDAPVLETVAGRSTEYVSTEEFVAGTVRRIVQLPSSDGVGFRGDGRASPQNNVVPARVPDAHQNIEPVAPWLQSLLPDTRTNKDSHATTRMHRILVSATCFVGLVSRTPRQLV
jgi:hypothetical protein